MPRAEQFSAAIADLGEGAYWDDRIRQFRMVDLLRGDVLTLDDSGAETRTHVSKIASVLRPRTGGGYLVGVENGAQYLTGDLEPSGAPIIAFTADGVRMNDGGCDPQGRCYIGSMAYDETPGAGALYRFDPDGTVTRVLTGVTVSNGIQWNADGSRVFFNDTATGRIDVFDFDSSDGTFHDRRDFATVPHGGGSPDGMAIDVEDGIWIALWGGSAVHRYDPDGTLTEVIELPVSKITCPAFGGPDRRTLYITTANIDVTSEPAAGAVFTAEVGVTGAVPYAFAG
jgi:sugar lactone lactonase YvrE